MNSTRSPVDTCMASRTRAGIVICPLLVTVALVMVLAPFNPYYKVRKIELQAHKKATAVRLASL